MNSTAKTSAFWCIQSKATPHLPMRAFCTCSGLLAILCVLTPAFGQSPTQSSTAGPASAKTLIRLTLPPDMELKTLIDLVSQRLGVHFLYDEQVANKRISINSPTPIPADSLLDVLRSALKMKGLALVDAEAAGWKRIVPAEELPQIAIPSDGKRMEDLPGTSAVTQTFALSHLTPEKVAKIIEPFLTKKGANTVSFADKNLLIVTDYAPNLARISRLVELIDQAGPERILRFQRIENIDASELAQQISQALSAHPGEKTIGVPPVHVSPDKRTNQLVIVGTHAQINEVAQLVRAFDVPLEQRTRVYAFEHVDADRVDRLVKETLDPLTASHLYHSAVDKHDNLLVATGSGRVHDRIAQLKKEMDIAAKRTNHSGVKFYRLRYADAQDVLNTLRAIDQRSTAADTMNRGIVPLGQNGLGGGPQNVLPQAGPNGMGSFGAGGPGPSGGAPPPAPGMPRDNLISSTTPSYFGMPNGSPPLGGQPYPPGGGSIVPGAARISIDQKSNSIIVIADHNVQQVYEDLIRSLDRPRPQVMIEAKIVVLDTSDNYSFGVEVSAGATKGAAQFLQFTSFGLSTVNPASGALALIPGQGFNWALIDPSAADAVIRAMANHTRSKVLSAPRLLVADNAVGTLASVQEVPFTSVNASNTVATTSFAGFAEAGTTIQVTPRIMDDDHLQLQFNVSLNSFTGAGSNGVPPPRQTDQIASRVTVPDGYTLIVGGLKNRSNSVSQNGIPFVESIPVLRELTSLQSHTTTETTLFIFLKPVILRDDKFRDLKFLSDRSLHCACEPGNFPESCPMLIK